MKKVLNHMTIQVHCACLVGKENFLVENKLWLHEMRPDPEQTISACQPSITHAINLKKANKKTFFSNGWVGLEGDGNKNTTALKLNQATAQTPKCNGQSY